MIKALVGFADGKLGNASVGLRLSGSQARRFFGRLTARESAVELIGHVVDHIGRLLRDGVERLGSVGDRRGHVGCIFQDLVDAHEFEVDGIERELSPLDQGVGLLDDGLQIVGNLLQVVEGGLQALGGGVDHRTHRLHRLRQMDDKDDEGNEQGGGEQGKHDAGEDIGSLHERPFREEIRTYTHGILAR